MSSSHAFPSPLGGVPSSVDFAPSILFAVLYGLLLPVHVYRLASKRSRQYVTIGTALFSIERIVFFSLRALEARNASERTSATLVAYLQTTLAAGFVSIGQDLVVLLRCMLVDSTKPKPERSFSPYHTELEMNELVSGQSYALPLSAHALEDWARDEPRARFWFRGAYGAASIAYWASLTLSVLSGALYTQAMKNGHDANLVQNLRYGSTAVALVLVWGIFAGAIWGQRKGRITYKATVVLSAVSACLIVVSIYRVVVMRFTTTSLAYTGPGSLSTTGDKAAFYLLHIAPEWLAVATVLSVNVKETFETGVWADWWSVDEKDANK